MDPSGILSQLLRPGEDPQVLAERLDELQGMFQLLFYPGKYVESFQEPGKDHRERCCFQEPFDEYSPQPRKISLCYRETVIDQPWPLRCRSHCEPLDTQTDAFAPPSISSAEDVASNEPDASSPSNSKIRYKVPSIVDKPLAGKCPRGHELAFTRMPYPGRCDGCIKHLEVTMGIMRCETCEYDLCFNCKLNGVKLRSNAFSPIGPSYFDPSFIPCASFDDLSRSSPYFPVTRRKESRKKKCKRTSILAGSILSSRLSQISARTCLSSSQESEPRPEEKAKFEHQERLTEVRMRAQVERKAELERELAQKASEKVRAVQRLAEEQRVARKNQPRLKPNDDHPKKIRKSTQESTEPRKRARKPKKKSENGYSQANVERNCGQGNMRARVKKELQEKGKRVKRPKKRGKQMKEEQAGTKCVKDPQSRAKSTRVKFVKNETPP